MEQHIATWYQKCGIYGLSPQQYTQRIESVREFCKKLPGSGTCCDLVKCFMGMPCDIDNFSELMALVKEKDISFSEQNTKEVSLLAGLAIYDLIDNAEVDYSEVAVMALLASARGNCPCEEDIFAQIAAVFDNYRVELRSDSDEITEVKVKPLKKMSDEERDDWSAGADYLNTALSDHNKIFKELNSNIRTLYNQLQYKREELNMLWWMVGGWSELYDCSLTELSDKEAAVAVPIELMLYVESPPGPLAVKKMMKKALAKKGLSKEYTYGDYISETGEGVLARCAEFDWDLSTCMGFTPILQFLHCRKDFPKKEDLQMARRLFEKDYDKDFLDKKVSVGEFANQLYLELELVGILG